MIGVDMEKIARFGKMDAEKFLTERELRYYTAHKSLETLAGFWCAKEAVVKAMGAGFFGFEYKDVEIRRSSEGQPFAFVPRVGLEFEISISHTDDTCVAIAVKKLR